jgi:uncharacterized repeat protein (TIGR03803 family)
MKKITVVFAFLYITGLVKAQYQIFGLNQAGGEQFGTIIGFPAGSTSITNQYTLQGDCGESPDALGVIEASGKLYGMTRQGGTTREGIIFEYDLTTGTYLKKFDFGGVNGSGPVGSLLLASNNKLYGLTNNGGTNGKGVLFEFDPAAGIYVKKIDFIDSIGKNPGGSLVEATNGKLYGMTFSGGINNLGVIFEYDFTTNVFTKKFDMTSVSGSGAQGSLTEAFNGKLYGMLRMGGANSAGTLFEYDYTANVFTKKIDFLTATGAAPYGSLMASSNNKLYGMCSGGGTGNFGVVFEFDIATQIYTKLMDFSPGLGFGPMGSLCEGVNGKLYGMTNAGGLNNKGTIFEYDTNANSCLDKIDLAMPTGCQPKGSLTLSSNGNLYGMGSVGGLNNSGVLFEYNYSVNNYNVIINFGQSDGTSPTGGLTLAANGKLYGTCAGGGVNGNGVLFEYDYANNTYTKKYDFIDSLGSWPTGSLVEVSPGKLYGITGSGGINHDGAIFEFDYLTNTYAKKVDLIDSLGKWPRGGLMKASNGKLYGMTNYGGNTNGTGNGVIFEYDYVSNVYTKKVSMTAAGGCDPQGSLTEAPNGKLYGFAFYGGANLDGVIFEYDFNSNTYTDVFDFNQYNNNGHPVTGVSPKGTPLLASNGKLYGTCVGRLFEYDYINNLYAIKYSQLSNTIGSLMQSANGKLYGAVTNYSTNGAIYEYDYNTNAFGYKIYYSGTTGSVPTGCLIELNTTGINSEYNQPQEIQVTPNPVSDDFVINYTAIQNKNAVLEIIDLYGKCVYRQTLQQASRTIRLRLPQLNAGIYTAKISSNEKSSIAKFLKN